ncbi:fimbrial-like protein [Escherichia coli]|nr:fimbrial-like protein [Escherichia coli]
MLLQNVALQMYMNDGTTAITPDTETGNILFARWRSDVDF